MTRRLVVTGPESTGKTTLAAALAAELGAPLILEAARAYAEEQARIPRALSAEDVEPIARRAIAAEDGALAPAPPLIVLDTDLLSTVVYARYYYGSCPPWIEEAARERRAELYLLADTDLPWTADGVRDRPLARAEMHALFASVLAEFGCTVALVSGSGPERLRSARAGIASREFLVPGGATR